MRTLYLMRHAKSDWPERDATGKPMADHDRPLSGRGERAARLMGHFMIQKGITPGGIIASSAQRTKDTAELLADCYDTPPRIALLPDLYAAEPSTMLARIQAMKDAPDRLVMIGHNPGIQDLILLLLRADQHDSTAAKRVYNKVPTAALAVINFDADSWDKIEPATGTLTHFVVPKDLV